jgi:hypothetical protein
MAKRLPIGKPGFDGRMEIVGDVVDSPYRRGEKEPVVRNIRESSLSAMHARGQIDDAQYRAGDWIRAQYERMRMGSGAIDPSYEPVDTSGHSDPIPDRLLRASLAIHDAEQAVIKEVGRRGWQLLECVCVEGCAIAEAAGRRYGKASDLQTRHVGMLFRDSLDVLATHLGLVYYLPTKYS